MVNWDAPFTIAEQNKIRLEIDLPRKIIQIVADVIEQ
jgi:hypothetical protein